ncbi:protein ACCELERATED CELL DEATH 6-like [Prosopis cineraria]|uniref:protein ACCELERATED CELL DEATH 6-like n=1 Tax=Prosopis cineraria TaxID=364024 RepID=UPI00240F6E05|nr:protein ACCELERATED CELL DEATH 6-like [Prosopis cineraria]
MRVILSKFDDASSKDDFIMLPNKLEKRALHEAILSKYLEGLNFLLSEQSESTQPLYRDTNPPESPIYVATQVRDVRILHRLLQILFPSGRVIHKSRGNSPLHASISESNIAYIGYVEGVRELLNKSNLVAFQRNLNGDLPIHIACQSSRVQVAKQLLHVKCPYTRFWLNNKGQNILHIAAENGQNKMVRFLLKHSNIHPENMNEKDIDGDAPLHLASRKLYLWTLLHLSRDKRTDANLGSDKGLNARDIVLMQAKHPMTHQEFRASMILRTAGVPLKKDMLGVQRVANAEWNVKDAANTLILVAVLIATVTFATSFTVPGGVYSSDDPMPKTEAWQCWLIKNYSKLFVHLALGKMLVAFMAAIYLVVSNNASLGDLVKVISFIFISFILLLFLLGYFPLGNRIPLLRQIGEPIFLIGLIYFMDLRIGLLKLVMSTN